MFKKSEKIINKKAIIQTDILMSLLILSGVLLSIAYLTVVGLQGKFDVLSIGLFVRVSLIFPAIILNLVKLFSNKKSKTLKNITIFWSVISGFFIISALVELFKKSK
ncbi:hypothetical protein NPX79_01720 [Spiroplasma endosymbiont of Anurida maritima]|uniref:hypothetical protein n=1 Tax=Spiroplasma endosymbiont of Anurida maritima TaxID=2967972 RepID=UPI0036D42D6E